MSVMLRIIHPDRTIFCPQEFGLADQLADQRKNRKLMAAATIVVLTNKNARVHLSRRPCRVDLEVLKSARTF